MTSVLYVCADQGIPLLGGKGAAVHVRALTSAWQALGHRVTLAIRRIDAGTAGVANACPRLHRVEHLPAEAGRAADQLSALIGQEQPAVVIERYSLQSGAARVATRRHGLPLTLEVNAPLAREATRYRGLDDPGAQGWEQQTFREADRIQVVSSALLRYACSIAPGVPAAWIPNGADVAAFRDAQLGPAPGVAGLEGRLVVGFAGSMKPWHGVADLLEAFARLPGPACPVVSPAMLSPMLSPVLPAVLPAVLLLVGDGPERDALRERAAAPDLAGRVVFTGAVPHDAIPGLVRRFDVAVAPYRPMPDFYFHPLKVVEYLAAGAPVVYPGQGDLSALVADAGLAYPPGDVSQLAARLARLAGDTGLRREMARAAAHRAEALDWRQVASRVLAFAAGRPAAESVPAGRRPAGPRP